MIQTEGISLYPLVHFKPIEEHAKSKTLKTYALIFIHGFLGDPFEWSDVASQLIAQFWLEKKIALQCYAFVLPAHTLESGQLRTVHSDTSFQQICESLHDAIGEQPIDDYMIAGYSLGGRIAFHYLKNYASDYETDSHLIGLFIESAHWGSSDRLEKAQRLSNDQLWANRFASEPLKAVLKDWYQQSVFSDMNVIQREQLIEKRIKQFQSPLLSEKQMNRTVGESLGEMLLQTSFAKQEELLLCLNQAAMQLNQSIFYIYGERDLKFKRMVEEAREQGLLTLPQWKIVEVPGVGHNIHEHASVSYLKQIKQFISHSILKYQDNKELICQKQ